MFGYCFLKIPQNCQMRIVIIEDKKSGMILSKLEVIENKTHGIWLRVVVLLLDFNVRFDQFATQHCKMIWTSNLSPKHGLARENMTPDSLFGWQGSTWECLESASWHCESAPTLSLWHELPSYVQLCHFASLRRSEPTFTSSGTIKWLYTE